jgi:YD repeat-containing protein
MDEGKVLLVNLAKGKIGEDSAALLGAMLVSSIGLAGLTRADMPEQDRRDFYLYMDEFQTFTTLSLALTKVTEPQPSSGTWDTDYSYNHFDQMTQVSMPRGANTQTRTFAYNGNGQMTSATNPESGTVTYAYNSEFLLASKTDAKNQKVEYSYDSLHRVTEVKRYPVAGGAEDACQNTKYYYDSNPFVSGFTSNAWGRPTAFEYKLCNGGIDRTVREMVSYTTGGQVTKKKFRLIHGSASGDLDAQYAWDWAGRMTAVTYPSQSAGISVNNVFDSMSRLSGITVTDGGNTVAWASNAQYGVRGEMTSLTWGGGSTTMTESRTYNVLGQMTRMTVQNQSATKYTDIEYAFSSTANNGRATYTKDWMSGEQVNYTYDSLNRLIRAETAGTGGWGNEYVFDGVGNLADKVWLKGTAPTATPAAHPATNRIIGESYDIENRLITWDNGTFYGYAADNRRVLKKTASSEDYSLFGMDGQRIGVYRWNGTAFIQQSTSVYWLSAGIRQGVRIHCSAPDVTM